MQPATHLGRPLAVVAALALLTVGYVGAAGPAAASEKTRRADIIIRSDADFTPAQGVTGGSGTASDPYVISGWDVFDMTLKDTNSYVLIQDNVIRGRLVLDWNGDRLRVTGNSVNDLRVNQNVERRGDATSGWIIDNKFGRVGQLRHFDGVFARNVVGHSGTTDLPFFNSAVMIVDGFNGARIRNNTVYGMVSVKLHGHHHGSGFEEGSHHHGHQHHGSSADHTQRYHRLYISGNRITHSGETALVFHDRAHSGDDRTARSEENPELNKPHIHHTRAYLTDNVLKGAGILVDIFNADDRNHTGKGRGMLHIANNAITTERELRHAASRKDAIVVRSAKSVDIRITGNRTAGVLKDELLTAPVAADAGIRLQDLDDAQVHIYDNEVRALEYGVFATRFSESVHWWIGGLTTKGVARPVYHDRSVANPPQDRP